MRRLLCCIVALLFLVSLAACARRQTSEPGSTPLEIARTVMDSQANLPKLYYLTSEDEEFSSYLSGYYQIDDGQVEDGVICYAAGVEAGEIAVLRMADEAAADAAGEALLSYIENRTGDFVGYAPQQAALAEQGIVEVSGRYAALLICPAPEQARSAFLGCFGETDGGEDSVPEGTADTYDPTAVLSAWQSGDDSLLSERNRSILQAAASVIEEEITDDMSKYEQELAVHDWMTGWSSFDMSAFSHAPGSGDGSDSDNPYGVLLRRTGNCWGYSSTFQLLMDMLDIECITVFGTPRGNGVEHAWNMVRLDGDWYCVDTAWDDPIGGVPGHRYFNVTSEALRGSGIHHWDETAVPEATGTRYSYGAS